MVNVQKWMSVINPSPSPGQLVPRQTRDGTDAFLLDPPTTRVPFNSVLIYLSIHCGCGVSALSMSPERFNVVGICLLISVRLLRKIIALRTTWATDPYARVRLVHQYSSNKQSRSLVASIHLHVWDRGVFVPTSTIYADHWHVALQNWRAIQVCRRRCASATRHSRGSRRVPVRVSGCTLRYPCPADASTFTLVLLSSRAEHSM